MTRAELLKLAKVAQPDGTTAGRPHLAEPRPNVSIGKLGYMAGKPNAYERMVERIRKPQDNLGDVVRGFLSVLPLLDRRDISMLPETAKQMATLAAGTVFGQPEAYDAVEGIVGEMAKHPLYTTGQVLGGAVMQDPLTARQVATEVSGALTRPITHGILRQLPTKQAMYIKNILGSGKPFRLSRKQALDLLTRARAGGLHSSYEGDSNLFEYRGVKSFLKPDYLDAHSRNYRDYVRAGGRLKPVFSVDTAADPRLGNYLLALSEGGEGVIPFDRYQFRMPMGNPGWDAAKVGVAASGASRKRVPFQLLKEIWETASTGGGGPFEYLGLKFGSGFNVEGPMIPFEEISPSYLKRLHSLIKDAITRKIDQMEWEAVRKKIAMLKTKATEEFPWPTDEFPWPTDEFEP